MKNEKRIKWCNRIFRYILITLFIAFFAIYLSQATGYYDYEQYQKMTFTEEQIKQFEKDVAEGKNIDIKNYLGNTNKDYQTKVSGMGLKLSEGIGKYVKLGIEKAFGMLGNMME